MVSGDVHTIDVLSYSKTLLVQIVSCWPGTLPRRPSWLAPKLPGICLPLPPIPLLVGLQAHVTMLSFRWASQDPKSGPWTFKASGFFQPQLGNCTIVSPILQGDSWHLSPTIEALEVSPVAPLSQSTRDHVLAIPCLLGIANHDALLKECMIMVRNTQLKI